VNLLAAGLVLVASVLFAVATALQQRVAADVPADRARGGRLLLRLVRERRWWIGAVLGAAGYAAHAAALGVGSLLLVQPLLVTTLLFALPLSARWAGRRLGRSDWVWSGVLAVALAVFLLIGQPTAGVERAPLRDWLPSGIVLTIVFVVCLVLAAGRRGTLRAVVLAAASAVAYGAGAPLTKGTVSLLPHGLAALFGHWEPYLLAVVMIGGALVQQSSFQAGHLQASLPTVTVGEPVIAVALGVVVLQEQVQATGPGRVLLLVMVLAMVLATGALARSAVRMEAPVTASDRP
jgi:hypothetical protein